MVRQGGSRFPQYVDAWGGDSDLFIYMLEELGDLTRKTKALMKRMDERGDVLLTSVITSCEILLRPRQIGRVDLDQRQEQTLCPPAVTVISFDEYCKQIYVKVRQEKKIKAPNAVQLSWCGRAGCDMFVTNDERLSRKVIPGIQFIAALDRALLLTGAESR